MPVDGSRSDADGQPRAVLDTAAEVLRAARAWLEHQKETGLAGIPLAAPRSAATAVAPPMHRPAPKPVQPEEVVIPMPGTKAALAATVVAPPTPPGVAEATNLVELRQAIGACTRCKLAGGRTNLVFGVGDPQARLMFVGEGPGRDEDLKGEPFVGRAGQLLTEIITNGMKMRREDVFIANVVKCRPPENRDPEPDEVAACRPFLHRQVDIVAPKVIVAWGRVAAQTLLETTTPIMRLRGNWFDYRGIPLMPTLHPAYLLRNPADKRLVWEDIKQVLRELEKHA